jgi:uncharacterized small protein (DUF1192 family)
MLAERYHWTPQQVDALDPDFVTELSARINAGARQQEIQRKRQEQEDRRKGKGRRNRRS